jgi:hypothetical protein
MLLTILRLINYKKKWGGGGGNILDNRPYEGEV